jgi:spore coat polysaccharide biosynthesis protein SpsF (cytidylyltransferase family)
VLEETLLRCHAIRGADVVVCTIPETAADDGLVPLIDRSKSVVARGSEDDVLARYLSAAEHVNADVVVRVTSDCPLIDPELCAAVISVRNAAGVDYAANNMPAGFPHGLDCEVFTTSALRKAAESTTVASDREHVTPWLRRSSEVSRSMVVGPGGRLKKMRWTLDFPQDLLFFQKLYEVLPSGAIEPWWKISDLLVARPEISQLNADCVVDR